VSSRVLSGIEDLGIVLLEEVLMGTELGANVLPELDEDLKLALLMPTVRQVAYSLLQTRIA
jgi:hypothetical protein